MMARFADASIRLKLIFAMALVTVLALLVSAVALGAYEVVTFRRALEQKLTIIADIVGRNCQVALAFDRPKDAGELLAALEAEPAVEIAAIYDRNGQLFASYNAPGHSRLTAPSTPAPTGVRFEAGALIVARRIVLDGDLLGTVYIRSGLDELAGRMRLFGLVVLAILTGCGLLAFVVSARLQRWIAAPILDLAHTARMVTSERNFALRATPAGGDEVGALVEDFNRMLVEIEQQDQRLRATRRISNTRSPTAHRSSSPATGSWSRRFAVPNVTPGRSPSSPISASSSSRVRAPRRSSVWCSAGCSGCSRRTQGAWPCCAHPVISSKPWPHGGPRRRASGSSGRANAGPSVAAAHTSSRNATRRCVARTSFRKMARSPSACR
jgi:HAMP domain-containing protein